MAVQPNGVATPCVFMPNTKMGDIREENLLDIWRKSDIGLKLSDRENYHYTCDEYRYICGGCRARALAYGDILGGDPDCIKYDTGRNMTGDTVTESKALNCA
jgi:radical SAM protein with 4Fe4S-binding SPASM domain